MARREDIEPRESDDETGLVGRIKLPDDPDQFRATLVEHLEELRTRIVRSVLFVTVGWIIGWYAEKPAFDWLSSLIKKNIESVVGPHRFEIIFRHFTDPFMMKIQISFLIGLILSLPFVILQLWGFVRPGLKPHERRPIERAAPLSLVLFALGVTFCCMILGPCTRWFATYLQEFPNTVLYQDPKDMIVFSMKMMLAFGLGFQLPLVVYALGAIGLLSYDTLAKYWRHGAVVIFFLAAAFTPSNDAFSMLMMAIPMVILFIISVWAVKITQGRKKQEPDS